MGAWGLITCLKSTAKPLSANKAIRGAAQFRAATIFREVNKKKMERLQFQQFLIPK